MTLLKLDLNNEALLIDFSTDSTLKASFQTQILQQFQCINEGEQSTDH